MLNRGRRLRLFENIRLMTRETRISKTSLIYPMFIEEGENIIKEIEAMPEQYRYSIDKMGDKLKEVESWGVKGVMFFGIPKEKDLSGSGAYHNHGIVQEAIRKAKEIAPNLIYIGDVCMCEYTSHGHCGILDGNTVNNDETLPFLAQTALSQVRAGADMVAPSDMMDGRVKVIRETLEKEGFPNIPIMSYAAKYASSFYGPFREAAGSSNFKGDRKTYQMDYHNRREAVKEVLQDISEGADIVMVKPALSYLDIIRDIKDNTDVPVAAYSVSGEYSMIKLAAREGLIKEDDLIAETTVSIFRAGADILITYFAKEICQLIDEGRIG